MKFEAPHKIAIEVDLERAACAPNTPYAWHNVARIKKHIEAKYLKAGKPSQGLQLFQS